jgi:hypothetical protein
MFVSEQGAKQACDQAWCQTCSGNAQRSEASSTMRGQAVRNGAFWLDCSSSLPEGSHCRPGIPAATGVVRTFQGHFRFTENKLRTREDMWLCQSHTAHWKRTASQKAAGGYRKQSWPVGTAFCSAAIRENMSSTVFSISCHFSLSCGYWARAVTQ